MKAIYEAMRFNREYGFYELQALTGMSVPGSARALISLQARGFVGNVGMGGKPRNRRYVKLDRV